MTFLGYGLALLIGLSLGLLGGGGSILTVPVLHFVLGFGVKEAIPMSLVVVGLTSAFGAALHARGGTLSWRAVFAFGPPAIVGALLGADLGLRVSARAQLLVFATVMLAAGVSMLARRRGDAAPADPATSRRPFLFVTLVGALVGLITGFAGVGGGFLYVPALVLLSGLDFKTAIGTSLVLIVTSCVAAVVRYQGAVSLDWRAIALFTGLAFIGVAVGSRLVPRVPQVALRKAFAVLLLLMGAVVLLRDLSSGVMP